MYPPSETTERVKSGVVSKEMVEGETVVVDEDVNACDGSLGEQPWGASSIATSPALKLSLVTSMKHSGFLAHSGELIVIELLLVRDTKAATCSWALPRALRYGTSPRSTRDVAPMYRARIMQFRCII